MEKTFTLTITGTEHGEWQGHLNSKDGSVADFQSLLELLKEISTELERKTR